MKSMNRFVSLSLVAAGFGIMFTVSALGQEANYDESKIPDYKLPELLTSTTGRHITTSADWERIRRPEVIKLFESHVYGRAPQKPETVSFRVDWVNENALEGRATAKEVTLFFSPDKNGPQVRILIFIPNGVSTPVPAFLGLNFGGNHTVHALTDILLPTSWMRNNSRLGITNNQAREKDRGTSSSRWAVSDIVSRGFALATAYYGDIDPDYDDGFQNGVHQLFYANDEKPAKDEWGSIATWAWGLSYALDYLVLDSTIDHEQVAVIGHSRLGKTALWAGAVDERFALVISNNSGCGGAALSRREFGETVRRINTSFPHWFCDGFTEYNHRVGELPVDQHMLIALAAPRPVYVASATEDRWADPNGEFLSAKQASEVYQLFGLKGITANEQPKPNTPIGSHIGYHLREGGHNVTDYDWEQYLNFAERHFR